MKKYFTLTIVLAAAGFLAAPHVFAQDANPAPKPQTSTTPKAQTPKTGSSTGTKPRTGTAGTSAKAPLTLTTQKDKVSYSIGLNIGKSLQKDSVDVDSTIFARGLKDGMTSAKPLLTEEEMRTVLTAVQTELRKHQEEALRAASEANKKAGDEFLAQNKAKDGVVAQPSGLQYKILTPGNGPKPTETDSVVCNYRGTLLDGTEFDSSYKRGQPATIPVNGVIKGWAEALQLMPVGSKWQLWIPAELAYGDRGAGGMIGPNSTLVFEVELISIQEKDKPTK